MFEYNGSEFYTQNDRDMAEIADLKAKVAQLENELALAKTNTEMAQAKAQESYHRYNNLFGSISKAEEAFKDILSGDTDSAEIVESYGAVLAEYLGWEFTREFEIELTVTYRGTIELPFGKDVDDLDASDFSVESYIGHDSYSADLTHWNSEVEER